MQPIFLFGALSHAPLRAVVLGGEVFARPALLPDHTLLTDAGALWAQLTPAFGSRVAGVILDAPSPEQMARLSFYLEGFGYGFAPLVLGEAGQTAFAPLRAGTEPRAGRFDAELWLATLAETVTETARDMMALFGRVSAAAMARRYPALLVRGAGRVRAAQTAPTTLRHRAGPSDVTLKGWRQPYAGFFAAEESDLSWRRFDGTMNPPVTRAGFVSGDAVTVLPYDPVRDRVLLVEQFRAGPYHRGDPQPWQLEPIAGRIDPGETPETAARREAVEEAGLNLGVLIEVARYYPTPGICTEFLYSYLALTDLPDSATGIFGLAEEAEDIRSHLVSFADLMDLVASGEAGNAPLILTALWLQRERPALREGLATESP